MTSPKQTAASLQVGDRAPKFSLNAHPGGTVSLDDFLGKKNVILAFYPKDDTPGCTKEMCSFSDDLSKFNSENTQVFGISCDTLESHSKFASKYSLGLTLLADDQCEVGKQFGTIAEGKRTSERVLFVIDKQGVVRYIHQGMPNNEELLGVVQKLK